MVVGWMNTWKMIMTKMYIPETPAPTEYRFQSFKSTIPFIPFLRRVTEFEKQIRLLLS